MLYFRPSSPSFATNNIESGVRGINGVKIEWNSNRMKLLIKAPIINKSVNFVPDCSKPVGDVMKLVRTVPGKGEDEMN